MDDKRTPPWGVRDFWQWASEHTDEWRVWAERYPEEWEARIEQQPAEFSAWAHQRSLQSMGCDHAATGNPLYVWRAIEACYDRQWHAWLMSHPEGEAFKESVRRNPQPPALTSLPDWCMRYLVQVALKFRLLERGLDEFKRPNERDFADEEAFREAFSAWRSNPTLSPQDAARRVAGALGVTRPGWNAFDADLRKAGDDIMLEAHTDMRDAGLSSAEAVEKIRAEYDLEEERSVWRRLARARDRRD